MRLFVLKDDFRMRARVSRQIPQSPDCSVPYGYTTAPNEIHRLSEFEYEEAPVKWIGPEWCPGLPAAHMITRGGHIEIRDGSRFRWPGEAA